MCETIEWESGTKSKSAIFAGTFPQKHIYYDTKILVDHTQSFLNCALLFNWTCVVILKILILASGFVSGVWYVPFISSFDNNDIFDANHVEKLSGPQVNIFYCVNLFVL